MGVYYNNQTTGNLEKISGQGKAEYGASTVRTGTIGVPAIAANADYADQTITFSTPMPDTDYLIDLSLQGSNTHRIAFHVVANTKTVNGFTVRFTPIGIKQTTAVGVQGVADNPNYTLTVRRDDTYPNLTSNTAIVDPTTSLPYEWNAMQTGYLKNPMPANEATLVYTAFKLYTDTEYNNLLNNAVLTTDVTNVVESSNLNPVTSNAVAIGRPEYYNKQLTVTAYETAQLSVTSAYLRGQKVVCKDGKTRIFGKIILGGVGNPNGAMNKHPCKLTGFPGPVTLLEGRLPCLVWSGWTGFYSMDNIANGVFAPIIAGGGQPTAEEACFTPQEVVVEVTE